MIDAELLKIRLDLDPVQITLHIGPHKTATTAVQTALARGMRALRRAGVLYPKTNWMFPAQHRLAFAMKARRLPGSDETPSRTAEIAELLRAIERHQGDRLLLSSEELFAAPPEAIAWLKDQLGGHEVRVLTFLRRPDNFLLSCYNQKIRQTGNGFQAPIRRFIRDPRQIAPEIDYRAAVSAWADVFGDAAILLETYEAGPPLARTLAHLGLAASFLPEAPRANVSISGALTETMRLAKMAGLSADRQRRVQALAAGVFADYPPFHLADGDRRSIIEVFEADNAALFARFGLETPYTAAALTPTPHPQQYNLTQQDLMRLVDHLL